MASPDRTDALLPSGRSEALDRLRVQLTEAQSRLASAHAAENPRAVAHWEGVIERIVQRGRTLPPGRDPADEARPAPRPPDMQAFIRRQLRGR
jgi:hypothetical protein